MKQEKISKNVEFEVIYDDGERKRVKEGILFEAKPDNTTMFHLGTERKSVYKAFFEATMELAQAVIVPKKTIKKDHTTHTESFKVIHKCRPIEVLRMQGIKIVKMENMSGWYLVDEGVKVEGANGANYGTAIICCPFCGEKL